MTTTIQRFDADAELLRAILWQYEDAEKLRAIVEAERAFFLQAQRGFWTDWLRDVFNFNTANDFGLAVWARILDVPLGVDANPKLTEDVFGFGPNHENFSHGNFGRWRTGQVTMTTEQKRLVVRLRYAQLTQRPTAENINRLLGEVFADFGGMAFVIDSLDMTIQYRFQFQIPSALKFVLQNFDLLLRPSTVRASIVETSGMIFNETALILG